MWAALLLIIAGFALSLTSYWIGLMDGRDEVRRVYESVIKSRSRSEEQS
jgi:hypothetical protein